MFQKHDGNSPLQPLVYSFTELSSSCIGLVYCKYSSGSPGWRYCAYPNVRCFLVLWDRCIRFPLLSSIQLSSVPARVFRKLTNRAGSAAAAANYPPPVDRDDSRSLFDESGCLVPWFHGKLSRDEARRAIEEWEASRGNGREQRGVFLFRYSDWHVRV